MAITLCFLPLLAGILIFTLAFKLKLTHQLLACLAGLFAVFIISVIQYFIPQARFLNTNPVLYSLLKSIIVYGLIEEAIKMAILWPLPHKNYDVLQALLLALVLGLAVGCFESAVYYFDHLQRANARGAQLILGQIFARIFTADILHMTCTGLCGLFVYSCRIKTPKASCLVYAILLHGIYDFFAGFQTALFWFSIVVVLLSIAECRIKYTLLQNATE